MSNVLHAICEHYGCQPVFLCMYMYGSCGWLAVVMDCFMSVDIAGTSVEQCEARYKEMLDRAKRERGSHKTFQAEFITADCSKVSLDGYIFFFFFFYL